jgi:hypothetical protein
VHTVPDCPWFKMSDDEVRAMWLRYLEQMFPEARREPVKHTFVHLLARPPDPIFDARKLLRRQLAGVISL